MANFDWLSQFRNILTVFGWFQLEVELSLFIFPKSYPQMENVIEILRSCEAIILDCQHIDVILTFVTIT